MPISKPEFCIDQAQLNARSGSAICFSVLLNLMFATLSGCSDSRPPVKDPVTLCKESRDRDRADYATNMANGQYHAAVMSIKTCAEILKDAESLRLLREAEIPSLLADINDKKGSPRARASAMQRLSAAYPDVGRKYDGQAEKLLEIADKSDAERARANEVRARKKPKLEGVSLGMSPEEVKASSWGKPRDINRTTTVWGVREQWVYDSGYLYFEDGKLIAIQE